MGWILVGILMRGRGSRVKGVEGGKGEYSFFSSTYLRSAMIINSEMFDRRRSDDHIPETMVLLTWTKSFPSFVGNLLQEVTNLSPSIDDLMSAVLSYSLRYSAFASMELNSSDVHLACGELIPAMTILGPTLICLASCIISHTKTSAHFHSS